MEYIHVKNLEKYHPGYKDRTLQWAKIYINMVCGDPDTEMIENEVDWARFIKIILLELRAQTPLPNSDSYWVRKGFDIKTRPMSLTIMVLHNFLEVVTNPLRSEKKPSYSYSYSKSDKDINSLNDNETNLIVSDKDKTNNTDKLFNIFCEQYPKPVNVALAIIEFKVSIKTDNDFSNMLSALERYKFSKDVKSGYVKNADKWLMEWREWLKFNKKTSEIDKYEVKK